MFNHTGGTVIKLYEPEDSFIFPQKDKNITWNTFTINIKIKFDKDIDDFIYKSFNLNLVKIKLNSDLTLPVLFVIAGFGSFISAAQVILTKLYLLGTKFRAIYILDYKNMKEYHNEICGKRKYKLDSEPEEKLNNCNKYS